VAKRLVEVARRIDPAEIGDLWIFPPLPDIETSAEFLVFTRYAADGRLRLYTVRRPGPARGAGGAPDEEPDRTESGVPSSGVASGPATAAGDELRAHGVVPADRVPRLLDRFQRRVGADHDPVHVELGGSEARWRSLVGAADGEDPGSPADAESAEDVDDAVVNP
jgi:hypothetical protein